MIDKPLQVPNKAKGRRDALLVLGMLLLAALLFHVPHLLLQRADTNNDFYLHHFWVKDFAEALFGGDAYPRWARHARFEMGEPVFLYYSPLYYFATSVLMALGASAWTSMQLVEVLASCLLGWTIYLGLNHHVRAWIAALAALAAMFSPFLVGISYKFNGFPWAVAICSFGLLFWAVLRPVRRGIDGWAALAIALLTLLHTVSGLMAMLYFSVAHGLVALSNWRHGRAAALRGLLAWGFTVMLGLALSAVYLVPALGSMGLISSHVWTQAYLPWHSFAFPTWSTARYGINWPAFQWPVALQSAVVLLVPAFYFWRTRHRLPALQARPVLLLTGVGVAALFLSSELAYPLWLLDTPIRKIQYPWRSLVLVGLPGLMLLALMAESMLRQEARAINAAWLPLGLLGASLAMGAASLYKAGVADARPLHPSLSQGEFSFGEFRSAFAQGRDCLSLGKRKTDCVEEYRVAAGYVGLPEYQTPAAKPLAVELARQGLAAQCLDLGARCSDMPVNSNEAYAWQVNAPSPLQLVLPVFDFPAWQLREDGKVRPHAVDERTGLIQLSLPAGEHRLSLAWQRLPLERWGAGISLLALALLGVLAWRQRGPGASALA